jgi:hypothetical protein
MCEHWLPLGIANASPSSFLSAVYVGALDLVAMPHAHHWPSSIVMAKSGAAAKPKSKKRASPAASSQQPAASSQQPAASSQQQAAIQQNCWSSREKGSFFSCSSKKKQGARSKEQGARSKKKQE